MGKIMRARVMAITLIMGLAMVAFLGLAVNAEVEPPLAKPTVTVTDTFAPDDDMNAYVGDTFDFAVPGYGMPHNDTNISAMITIGPLAPAAMTWNDTNMEWVYSFTPDAATYVGTHTVTIEVKDMNNETNMNSTETMITIWQPVMPTTGYTIPDLTEDMMWAWNLTEAFMPMMDQAGNFLTFGVGPEGFPADWTFTPITVSDVYPWWEVTPPMDFEGSAMVNVTATDTNGNMDYMMFDLMVNAVNDVPMIKYIMADDVQVDYEMYNYTWVEEEVNMSEFRNVINLTFEEDGNISFMINAMDVETMMMDLEYDFELGDAPVTFDNLDMNETNVTVPYNFTFMGDMNANGMYWVNFTVSDDEFMSEVIWIMFDITPVNDAPTGAFGADYSEGFDIKTEEEINVSATGSDVDTDDMVSFIWKVDGIATGDMEYFVFSTETAGTYNISAEVTDGTSTVEIGYFMVTVEVANTAPVIVSVTVYPDGLSLLDLIDFLDREVEEGKDVELTCVATDAEGDTLTYTWTNDQDSSWTATGDVVIVSSEDMTKGLSYVFTCTVSDGLLEDSEDALAIKIVEEKDDPSFLEACGLVLLVPVIILVLIIIVVIVIIMKKKGKKEDEMSEEAPMGGEMPMEEPGMEGEMPMEEPAMEGEMPVEGMEQPVQEEVPMEQPVEAPVEQPVEAPVEAPVEEPVAPPVEPAPEQPVAPPVEPAPEQPPAPPMPPQ